MISWRRIRAPAEVALARGALATLPRLSRRAILRIAGVLGMLGYLFGGRLRRVGAVNLAIAFPEKTSRERARMLRGCFRTFALTMLDTFWFARDTVDRMTRHVHIHPGLAEALFRPASQVCVTAHLGNWEVLGMSVTLRGWPLVSVTAPLKNPAVDPIFTELRHVTGQRTVPKQGAVRHLLRTLKEGGKVALVLDQNTRPAEGGVFVDFFGLPAPMSTAAAALAYKTSSEIIVAGCVPDETGDYRTTDAIRLSPESAETEPDAIYADLTRRIAAALESMVREHAVHWMWTYKRWKLRRPDLPRERYPFYSHLDGEGRPGGT